jgi:hypothetical protein
MAWLGARRSGRLRRRALGWLAAGLIFVDLASVGAHTDLGAKPPTKGFDHPQIVEFLQSEPGVFRIDSRTDIGDVWQPSLALLSGLYDVSGVDNPLVVGDIARYWEGTGGRSTQLYDLLGVRYLLGSKEIVLDWDKFTLVDERDPQVNVYRNETALPRAFVVHRVILAGDQEDAWTRIHQPGFDPASTVVLEGGQPLDGQTDVDDRVQITLYQPHAVVMEVEAGADGFLFLSDPFYPGWRAEVDGAPATILRANYAFRAVALPAGKHQVTMTFRPGMWYAGLAVSLLTCLVLVITAGVALARRVRTD